MIPPGERRPKINSFKERSEEKFSLRLKLASFTQTWNTNVHYNVSVGPHRDPKQARDVDFA